MYCVIHRWLAKLSYPRIESSTVFTPTNSAFIAVSSTTAPDQLRSTRLPSRLNKELQLDKWYHRGFPRLWRRSQTLFGCVFPPFCMSSNGGINKYIILHIAHYQNDYVDWPQCWKSTLSCQTLQERCWKVSSMCFLSILWKSSASWQMFVPAERFPLVCLHGLVIKARFTRILAVCATDLFPHNGVNIWLVIAGLASPLANPEHPNTQHDMLSEKLESHKTDFWCSRKCSMKFYNTNMLYFSCSISDCWDKRTNEVRYNNDMILKVI